MLYYVQICIALFFHISYNPVSTHIINQIILYISSKSVHTHSPVDAQRNKHTISGFTFAKVSWFIVIVMLVVDLIDIERMQSVIKVFLFCFVFVCLFVCLFVLFCFVFWGVCVYFIYFFFFKNFYCFSDLETLWQRNPELKEYSVILRTSFYGMNQKIYKQKAYFQNFIWFQLYVFKLCMIMCVPLLL